MYVTGRDKTGTGTILSSLAQLSKSISIEEVRVVSKSISSKKNVAEAAARINKLLSTKLKVEFSQIENSNASNTFLKKEKFDLAIISVPDHLHFQYAKTILENKIHCLIVKPLTPTADEAEKLISIQHKNSIYAAVEFHKRWDETNLTAKKLIQNNTLGKINYFTVDYSQRIDIPTKIFKGWASKTNIFQYLGVHYADLIYFLTGFSPLKLSATGTDGILKQKGIDTFDSVHAKIIWQNPKNSKEEFVSMLNINWIDPNISSAMSDQKFTVVGTKGRLECDQKKRGLELVTEETGIQHLNPYFSDYLPDVNGNLQFGGYGFESIKQFVCDIIDLKNGKTNLSFLEKNRPSFRNSLVSVKIIDAVNESLKKNSEWVKI